MSAIPDINDTEKWTIRSSLNERWGKDKVEFQLVDVEARLDASDHELTECPAFYWEQGECHFVIIKTGENHYRNQFYYDDHEQFGSGIDEYEDPGDCVISLLRLQSDHARDRQLEQTSD